MKTADDADIERIDMMSYIQQEESALRNPLPQQMSEPAEHPALHPIITAQQQKSIKGKQVIPNESQSHRKQDNNPEQPAKPILQREQPIKPVLAKRAVRYPGDAPYRPRL